MTFEVDQYLEEQDGVLEELKAQLTRAPQIMKARADGKRRFIEFNVGDGVYSKLQPYRQKTMEERINMFLDHSRCWLGLETWLQETIVIHSVFHASQLKKVVGYHPAGPDFHEYLTE